MNHSPDSGSLAYSLRLVTVPTIWTIFLFGIAGCTTTRAVTPWLRIHERAPFELMAESGRGPHGHRAWVDRKVDGRWVPVSEADPVGFSFANDTRAVAGNVLLTRDGRTLPLPCPHTGRIGDGSRAAPGGGLVCVVSRGAFDHDIAPEDRETVTVTHLTDDGAERARLRAGVPIKRPAGAPPLSIDIDTSFVGFLGDELVFAVLVIRERESWATEEWKQADAWALTAGGNWRKLGTLHFQVSSAWQLHVAACWASALGLPINAGHYPQDTDSRPRWSSCN